MAIENKLSSIKQQLREASLEAQNLGLQLSNATDIDSESLNRLQQQFSDATSRAAQLRDQINDTNEQIAVLTAGSKFEVLGNGIQDVVGKIASLDFEGAAESANRLVQISKSINFGDAVQGVKDIGSTFVSLGRALLTNPLFLIAAAIALAVTYASELFSLIDGVSSKDEERLATLTEQASASKAQLDSISAQEERLKASGLSEEEILQLKIDQAKVAAADAKAQLDQQIKIRDEQVAAAERNKQILKGILDFVSLPLTFILAGIDELTSTLRQAGFISEETFATIGNLRERFKETVSTAIFDPEETAKEGDAAVKEAEKAYIALDNQLAGFENRQKANRQKAASERKAAADKEAEENKKRAEKEAADRIALEQRTQKAIREANDERLNSEEEIQELIFQAGLTQQQKEIQALRDFYFEKIELAKQFGLDATALENELATKEKEINDTAAAAASAKQDDQNREALEKAQALSDARIETANNLFNGLTSLSDIFEGSTEKQRKQAFNRNKALGIAQATIQTYQSATAAYASQLTIPSPDAPVRAAIAAGAAVAAGLGQVAKIAKTRYEGGSTSGGGGGGASISTGGFGSSSAAPATPAFNLFGQGNQLNTVFGGQNGGPQTQPLSVNVSISETEITQTQNFVRRVSESAVL